MSEKLAEVYEQYDMEIISTRKGRGSTIINTADGMRILEPFRGSMVRLEQEYVLKQLFRERGCENLDHIIPNREGQLFTCDKYRQPHVLKKHFEGVECDMNVSEDLKRTVAALSNFHKEGMWVAKEFEERWNETRRLKEERRVAEIREALEDGEEMERVAYLYEISQSALEKAVKQEKMYTDNHKNYNELSAFDGEMSIENVKNRFVRHNAQINKIHKFVGRVKRRNSFENLFLEVCQDFYEQGLLCVKMLGEDVTDDRSVPAVLRSSNDILSRHYGICHGSFNQHNVILEENNVDIVHFERFSRGNQLNDLYQFCRKAMEKNHFDFELLMQLFEEYGKLIKLTAADYQYMYVMFSYPEKFWKIANGYYNSNKAFLSPKYLEKLETVIYQEKEKQEMLDAMKSIVFQRI